MWFGEQHATHAHSDCSDAMRCHIVPSLQVFLRYVLLLLFAFAGLLFDRRTSPACTHFSYGVFEPYAFRAHRHLL